MSRPAIVSLLWKDLGVLESFVRDNPRTRVFAAQGSEDPELVSAIAAAGGELLPLHGLLFAHDVTRAKAKAMARVARLETFFGGEEWARYSSDHGWPEERLGVLVTRRAQTDLPEIATALAALDRIDSLHALRLVIVNEDWTPRCRAVVLWANEHGVPSLHLGHSLDLCDPYTAHGRVMSTTMAVFGDRGTEPYLDADADMFAPRIRVTGNPAWDSYPQVVQERETIRAELAATHGCSLSLPWVMFATTWTTNQTAFTEENVYGSTLRQFLTACKALVDADRQICIVIKDRVPNQAFGRVRLAEIVSELGLDPDHVTYTLDDIEKWVVAVDVVVSVFSNVSVEALLASTPAINLVTTMDGALGPPFDADSGIVEAEGHELAAALEKILSDDDYRDRLREQMRQAAPRYNLGFDGSATARVVELMEELALPADGRRRPLQTLIARISAGWSAIVSLVGGRL